MAEEKGVWRTVSGRRVFIKEGQSLSSAMKESGKFKSYGKGVTSNAEDYAKIRGSIDHKREYGLKSDIYSYWHNRDILGNKDAIELMEKDYKRLEELNPKSEYLEKTRQYIDSKKTETYTTFSEKDLKGLKTQKQLRDLANNKKAKDITTLSNEKTKALREKEGGLEIVKRTKGTYGTNGALLMGRKSKNYYVITSRSSNLFYWV